MNDTVERLRAMARREHDDLSIGDEAADEIDHLRAALREASALLKHALSHWPPRAEEDRAVIEALAIIDAALSGKGES